MPGHLVVTAQREGDQCVRCAEGGGLTGFRERLIMVGSSFLELTNSGPVPEAVSSHVGTWGPALLSGASPSLCSHWAGAGAGL